ncbi:MAG: Arc family DNA-binding protein [Planctomycetes bacterium]|nr:Arc family DNA-binding protein [Planctomycetota bacterium]
MNLSIKNVPEETVRRLRERAKAHHRSVQGELLAILEKALEARPLSLREARERLASLRLTTPEESSAMVREDRDAR